MKTSMIEQIKSFIAPLIKGQDFWMIDNSVGHPVNTRTLTVYSAAQKLDDLSDVTEIVSIDNLRVNTTTGEVIVTAKNWTSHWDISELDQLKNHIINLLRDESFIQSIILKHATKG